MFNCFSFSRFVISRIPHRTTDFSCFFLSWLLDQLCTLWPADLLHGFQVFLAERYLQPRKSSTYKPASRPSSAYRPCIQMEGPSEPHCHRALLLWLESVHFPERYRLLQPSSCQVLHGWFQRYPRQRPRNQDEDQGLLLCLQDFKQHQVG